MREVPVAEGWGKYQWFSQATSSEHFRSGPRMKSSVYHAFLGKSQEFSVQHPGTMWAEAFPKAFLEHSLPHTNQLALDGQLQRRAFAWEHFTCQKRKIQRPLCQVEEGVVALCRYNRTGMQSFSPLHKLWKQYIQDLCSGLKPDSDLKQPRVIQEA